VTGPTPTDRRSPSAELHALGVRCQLEARGNLAIVTPAPGERGLEEVTLRRRVLAVLRSHGFSHVAIEPGDETESQPPSSAGPA
jgi:hypothetical protein